MRPTRSPLAAAVQGFRRPLMTVGMISSMVNLLALTGPLFMMLVYDKVLASRSLPTLIALCLLALILYAFYGLLEGLRARMLARIGASFDHRLAPRLFDASLRLPLHLGRNAKNHDPIQDLGQIREFLMGSGPSTLFDLPWMPIYLGILYVIHPLLGLTALIGALILVGLTIVNEALARAPVQDLGAGAGAAAATLADARRNAEAAAAMGMGSNLCARWAEGHAAQIAGRRDLADHTGLFGAATRTVRFVLQSAMLAVGALLVIRGELSPGAMIAGSILVSRALAPVDQAIAQWRGYAAAWNSWKRLKALTGALAPVARPSEPAPKPVRALSVKDLAVAPPGAGRTTLLAGSFVLEAGDALGVIGPSGSGKSTLARALAGAWTPARGGLRLDGLEYDRFGPEGLGEAIGYLPQDVELFDGTVAENIARFRRDATEAEVRKAAELAGVHEMIQSLPQGYHTQVGEGGAALSGGQRQRIGLARAVFGDPFLVVLDEPNASLDPVGEQALTIAVQKLRKAGKIVVIAAHRPSAIFAANKILALKEGRPEMFGPKREVMTALFAQPNGQKGQAQKPAQPKPQAPAAAPAAPAQAAAPARPAAQTPAQAPAPAQPSAEARRDVTLPQPPRPKREPQVVEPAPRVPANDARPPAWPSPASAQAPADRAAAVDLDATTHGLAGPSWAVQHSRGAR